MGHYSDYMQILFESCLKLCGSKSMQICRMYSEYLRWFYLVPLVDFMWLALCHFAAEVVYLRLLLSNEEMEPFLG